MEEQKVDTLWNLAMKSMILSWKSAVDKFGIDIEFYEGYEDTKNSIVNSKDIQDLVKYHKPHREFLHVAKKINDFISHYEKNIEMENAQFSTLMCWLCFFNSEVIQWRFWYPVMKKDSIIYSYIKKHEIKLSKCKTTAIELQFPIACEATIELSDDEIYDLFTKIPNVEDLRLALYHSSTSIAVNEKIMTKILPKFQFLRAFKTKIDDSYEMKDFCHFIKKSPKIIQHLELTLDEFGIKDFKEMMNALEFLPQLATLNIDFGRDKTFSRQEIESLRRTTKLESVKNLAIWIKDLSILEFISKYFIDLRSMKIIIKNAFLYEGKNSSLRSELENCLFGLTAFSQVESLCLNLLPTHVSAIWKTFPNLKEFTCKTMELSRRTDFEKFCPSTSLEKLTLRSLRDIFPFAILRLIFPNLKWLVVQHCNDELTAKIQPHLPTNCKISKMIDIGIEEERASLVTDSFVGFGKWCW